MMVMPRSRSRSMESITRSRTCSFSRKVPDCRSIASTSVVLPWSTCAIIAIFRMFLLSDIEESVGISPAKTQRRKAERSHLEVFFFAPLRLCGRNLSQGFEEDDAYGGGEVQAAHFGI